MAWFACSAADNAGCGTAWGRADLTAVVVLRQLERQRLEHSVLSLSGLSALRSLAPARDAGVRWLPGKCGGAPVQRVRLPLLGDTYFEV